MNISFSRKKQIYSVFKTNNQMMKWQKILQMLVFFCVLQHSAKVNAQTLWDLGEDVMINGDFSKPEISPPAPWKGFLGEIPGWTCSFKCELINCELYGAYSLKNFKKAFANCTGLVIDSASSQIELITQTVQLTSGQYYLQLTYYLPTFNASQKTFLIYFNSQLLLSYRPPFKEGGFSGYLFQQKIETQQGMNNLTITMDFASGTNNGFPFGNVSLRRVINIVYQTFIEKSHSNPIITSLIQFPGSRIVFSVFLSSFINLDRLQLYKYHNRSHSYYSAMLFNQTDILLHKTGKLFSAVPGIPSQLLTGFTSRTFGHLNFKTNYTEQFLTQKLQNPEYGDSFLLNQLDFFFEVIPSMAIIYLLFLLYYKITKRWPISDLAKKYSFFGIFFIMIFEGNIEELTFFAVGELMLFFSCSQTHKFVNVLVVFFLFVVTVFSFSFLVWVKVHYQHKAKHFLENHHHHLPGIVCSMVDRFSVAFLFGVVHRVMIKAPDAQLGALAALEIAWIISRLRSLSYQCYKSRILIILEILLSVSRICLQTTLFIYSNYPSYRFILNKEVHFYLIIVLLSLFFLTFFIGITRGLKELKKIKKVLSRDNKIANDSKHSKKVKKQVKKQTFVAKLVQFNRRLFQSLKAPKNKQQQQKNQPKLRLDKVVTKSHQKKEQILQQKVSRDKKPIFKTAKKQRNPKALNIDTIQKKMQTKDYQMAETTPKRPKVEFKKKERNNLYG